MLQWGFAFAIDLQSFDWAYYTKLFLLGAFPWITQLRKLPIHFESTTLPNLKAAFNLFASIFSMSLYIMMRGTMEKSIIATFPRWYWFMILGLIFLIIYFSIYVFNKSKVKQGRVKWIIPLNLFFYICLFLCFTSAFGILRIYSENYVLEGKVIDAKNKSSVNGATVKLFTPDDKLSLTDDSDKEGNFLILFDKKTLDSILDHSLVVRIKAEHDRPYGNWIYTVEDPSNLEDIIKEIPLPNYSEDE